MSKGTDIQKALGKALGVVATDLNNDGLMDLFVANDTVQNFLFMNRGKGKWEEIGLASEVGFSRQRPAPLGHGSGRGRLRRRRLAGPLRGQRGPGDVRPLQEQPATSPSPTWPTLNSVSEATRLLSGWGLKFFDYDNDGQLDLFLANGHPDDMIDSYGGQVKYRGAPPPLPATTASASRTSARTRGPSSPRPSPPAAWPSATSTTTAGSTCWWATTARPPSCSRTTPGAGNHWLGLRLEGSTCNRDAIGALLTWSVGGVKRTRLKTAGGSYLSSHDPREVLGLGAATKVDWLEIRWPAPSGKVERFEELPVDRYVRIVEGKGIKA